MSDTTRHTFTVEVMGGTREQAHELLRDILFNDDVTTVRIGELLDQHISLTAGIGLVDQN